MQKRHTRKQIIESIKHWENVLKSMNEAEYQLLQALSDEFSKSKLFSKTFKTGFNEDFFRRCYGILNEHFFSSKLDNIPIYYKSDAEIRDFLIKRKNNKSEIPDLFFGTYSVLYDNDSNVLKWTDDLILHDDVILLNIDHIEHKSLIFAISCLCHEMIHYYDRLFGEFCNFRKYYLITRIKKNIHNTLTFEDMKDKANELGINVIQEIPKGKNARILDKEAIDLLFQKFQNGEIIVEDENESDSSTIITRYENGKGGCITTF